MRYVPGTSLEYIVQDCWNHNLSPEEAHCLASQIGHTVPVEEVIHAYDLWMLSTTSTSQSVSATKSNHRLSGLTS
jgi:hypothetical protein